jgi:3-ketoacyl-CoA synthase
MLFWYLTHRENPLYILDFALFSPPEDWKVSPDELLQAMRNQDCFSEDSIQFMDRMLKQSGVGPSTAWV